MAAKRTAKKSVKKAAKKTAKPATKRAVAKKATSGAAKRPVKKAVKRAAKKTATKSATKRVKKVAKKSATKSATTRVKKSSTRVVTSASRAGVSAPVTIPEVPSRTIGAPTSIPATDLKPASSAPVTAPSSTQGKKKGSGPFFFILVGVLAIALIFASQSGDDSNESGSGAVVEESTSPSPVASEEATEEASEDESMEEESMEEGTVEEGAVEEGEMPTSYDAPTGIVAQYTNNDKSAATIFWKAPASTTGVTGYAIQIQRNGGAREDLSSTPSTQFTLDITKSASTGWTSFIVQTVYSDGEVVDGKVFGLPGQWN